MRSATACSPTSWADAALVLRNGPGPIYLGYRVGHVKGDSRVFRAVIYNKSAVVLHMLRRLVGDEKFFAGLRRFYREYRFRKAGTDDLRRVMEQESGLSLERFFEQWIYGRAARVRHARTSTDRGRGCSWR
jgi:aminopeptidase N